MAGLTDNLFDGNALLQVMMAGDNEYINPYGSMFDRILINQHNNGRRQNKPSLLARALDLLSRGNYMSANAVKAATDGDASTNPFVEAWHGLKGEDKTTYRDVLDQVAPNMPGVAKATLGFAGDVFLDPTTYIGTGVLGKAGKVGEVLTKSGEQVAAKLGQEGLEKATKSMVEEGLLGQRKALSFMGKSLLPESANTAVLGAVESVTDALKGTGIAKDISKLTKTVPFTPRLADVLKESGAERGDVLRALQGSNTAEEFATSLGLDATNSVAKNAFTEYGLREQALGKREADRFIRGVGSKYKGEVESIFNEAKKLGISSQDLLAFEKKGAEGFKPEAQPLWDRLQNLMGERLEAEKAAGVSIDALDSETLNYLPRRMNKDAKDTILAFFKDNESVFANSPAAQRIVQYRTKLGSANARIDEWKDLSIAEINDLAKKGELTLGGVNLPALENGVYDENVFNSVAGRLMDSVSTEAARNYAQKFVGRFGMDHETASKQAYKEVQKILRGLKKDLGEAKGEAVSDIIANTSGKAWNERYGDGFYEAVSSSVADLKSQIAQNSKVSKGDLKFGQAQLENIVTNEVARMIQQTTGKTPSVAEAKKLAYDALSDGNRLVNTLIGSGADKAKTALQQVYGAIGTEPNAFLSPKEVGQYAVDAGNTALNDTVKTVATLLSQNGMNSRKAFDTALNLASKNVFDGMKPDEVVSYVTDALSQGATGKALDGLVSKSGASKFQKVASALDEQTLKYSTLPETQKQLAREQRWLDAMDNTSTLGGKKDAKDFLKQVIEGTGGDVSKLSPEVQQRLQKALYAVDEAESKIPVPEGWQRLGLTEVNGAPIEGVGDKILPKEFAENLVAEYKKFSEKDPKGSALLKAFDTVQGAWKGGTLFNWLNGLPFMVRNEASNLISMGVRGGMAPQDMPKGLADAYRLGKASEDDVIEGLGTVGELRKKEQELGLTGGFTGDIVDPEGSNKYVEGLNKVLGVEKMSKLNGALEDNARRALWLDGMRKGLSPEEAADNVFKALFDYADLTDFEKDYAKRFIPFYAFSRKNIPATLETLITKPGQSPVVLGNKLAENLSDGDRTDLPEWGQDSLAVVNGGKYNPVLGSLIPDLQGFQSVVAPFQTAKESISPLVQLVTGNAETRRLPFESPVGGDAQLSKLMNLVPGYSTASSKVRGMQSAENPLDLAMYLLSGSRNYEPQRKQSSILDAIMPRSAYSGIHLKY